MVARVRTRSRWVRTPRCLACSLRVASPLLLRRRRTRISRAETAALTVVQVAAVAVGEAVVVEEAVAAAAVVAAAAEVPVLLLIQAQVVAAVALVAAVAEVVAVP